MQLGRQHLARMLCASGIKHPTLDRLAWHPLAYEIVRAAMNVQADLYVAHYVAALPAAALAARKFGAKYAFDAEDFHLGEPLAENRFEGIRARIRVIEGQFLHGCSYISAASPGIAASYVSTYGVQSPSVILNTFPRSEAPSSSELAVRKPFSPSLYWFSQTVGRNRGLECALRACALSKCQPAFFVRGHCSPSMAAELTDLAKQLGIGSRFHLLPTAPPDELPRLAADYDVGLAGEPGHSPNNNIAISNKVFTYLLAGLPIVMSNTEAQRWLATEMGVAAHLYEAENPASLAAALDRLLTDPQVLEQASKHARNIGQHRFNWDIEKVRLVELVRSVL
jgi:glycosyltransferase involved in cell wall biosynthesis